MDTIELLMDIKKIYSMSSERIKDTCRSLLDNTNIYTTSCVIVTVKLYSLYMKDLLKADER